MNRGRSRFRGPAAEDAVVAWTFSAGDGKWLSSSPVVAADGTIYLGSYNGWVYALAPDGTKKWEFLTDGWITSPPAIGSDGTVYVASGDSRLYALSAATGQEKWRFQTGSPIDVTAPVEGPDGTVYVGSDRRLHAVTPAGVQKWELFTQARIEASPAVGSNGTVYVASAALYAVGANGSLLWHFNPGDGLLMDSSPAIGAYGVVYVGSQSGYLYAVNPDGSKRWQVYLGDNVGRSSPAVGADGNIYIGSSRNALVAISSDGRKLWEFATGGPTPASPVVDSDGTVYTGALDAVLYAVGPDGTERWRFVGEDGGQIWTSPAITGNGQLLITSGQTLFAIGRSR